MVALSWETVRGLLRAVRFSSDCSKCAAKDEIARSRDAELARCYEREKLDRATIQELQRTLSALTDLRATAAVARMTSVAPHPLTAGAATVVDTSKATPTFGGPAPKRPSVKLPPWIGQLAGGGNVDMRKLRSLSKPEYVPEGLPPVAE